jgi:threonine aldolase
MLFTSDNWGGVHPDIWQAIKDADGGFAPAYGNDETSRAAQQIFEKVFARDVALAFVPTGSAANGLALSLLSPPYGAVICHEHAHIMIDECGAPEFYTGGAKLIPAKGAFGKLTPESVAEAMAPYDPPMAHRVKPSVLSLTQATEWGTLYTPEEIRALSQTARSYGLKVHMDGARFAGAVNALGAAPADLTWASGVDILCMGATKNGCLQAEAVVVFDETYKEELTYRAKRAGLGTSKQRFFSAQWPAYFGSGLWTGLAEEARQKCLALAEIFDKHSDCGVIVRPRINELFVTMPDETALRLRSAGAQFYDWVQPNDQYAGKARRFVTSWETTEEQIGALKAAL